ncbi:hypothetical protein HK096_009918, partial [Nowakowskiella sp. JEL0078]
FQSYTLWKMNSKTQSKLYLPGYRNFVDQFRRIKTDEYITLLKSSFQPPNIRSLTFGNCPHEIQLSLDFAHDFPCVEQIGLYPNTIHYDILRRMPLKTICTEIYNKSQLNDLSNFISTSTLKCLNVRIEGVSLQLECFCKALEKCKTLLDFNIKLYYDFQLPEDFKQAIIGHSNLNTLTLDHPQFENILENAITNKKSKIINFNTQFTGFSEVDFERASKIIEILHPTHKISIESSESI